VNEDNLITVTEFMCSPGMQYVTKAREVVRRHDKSGAGKLSCKVLEAAYKARHADRKKPDPATLAASAKIET
jgi:hypothetical protein